MENGGIHIKQNEIIDSIRYITKRETRVGGRRHKYTEAQNIERII